MFAIHPFSFLSQCLRRHFCELWTHAMRDVANCDAVCGIFFGDNVDYHSIARIWNGSDTNYIVTIHESNALSFVFVICHRCCWITSHSLSKPKGRVGIRVQWHTKCERGLMEPFVVYSFCNIACWHFCKFFDCQIL